MSKVKIGQKAPDFTLQDFKGQTFWLSDYLGEKIVLLIFNRGFM